MLMAGANVTMLCSVLLRHGIKHLRVIEEVCGSGWRSTSTNRSQMQGSMSQKNCPDPSEPSSAPNTCAQ